MTQAIEAGGPPHEEELTTADYSPPKAGPVTHFLCGAVVTALGAGSLVVAWNLGFGSLTSPQAGTWPGLLSVLLTGLGIAIMILAKGFDDAEKLTKNAIAVGAGALSLVVAVLLMPYIGFEIPATLLMILWMSGFGQEKFRLSVPIAVVTVIIYYLIFVTGLNVPIPRLF